MSLCVSPSRRDGSRRSLTSLWIGLAIHGSDASLFRSRLAGLVWLWLMLLKKPQRCAMKAAIRGGGVKLVAHGCATRAYRDVFTASLRNRPLLPTGTHSRYLLATEKPQPLFCCRLECTSDDPIAEKNAQLCLFLFLSRFLRRQTLPDMQHRIATPRPPNLR